MLVDEVARGCRELGDLAHADRVARAGLNQAREHLDGRDEPFVHFSVRLLEQLGGARELGRALCDFVFERRAERRELLRLARRQLTQPLAFDAQARQIGGVRRIARGCGPRGRRHGNDLPHARSWHRDYGRQADGRCRASILVASAAVGALRSIGTASGPGLAAAPQRHTTVLSSNV